MFKILTAAASAALACAVLATPAPVSADCKLLQIAEFKLDPNSTSPIVDGSINGHPVKVLLDSGADFSQVTYYEAQKIGLPTVEAPGWRAYGVGGSTQMYWAHVNRLNVGGLSQTSVDLAVAGDRHAASDVEVVIGDDVLSKADLEFDLAHKAIRMFQPQGCSASQLVYWGATYSQVDLLPWERDAPKLQVRAYVNGKLALAELDSGAEATLIDASAAAAVGVTHDTAEAAADPVHGAGPKPEDSWLGRFDSFALGDEKIGHINIQVANILRGMRVMSTASLVPYKASSTVMFIGDDFLRAHRVFVDNRDHLILFSYQGGPVFSTGRSAASAK